MQGASFVVSPIPDHAFFEQPVLERQARYGFLESGRLRPQVLHLWAGRLAGRVASQPALARLEELL